MTEQFSNSATSKMFQRIKETQPEQLISDAQEASVGYIGLDGIASEVKSEYSTLFAEEFSEQELAQVAWKEIVNALASLSQ